ncbi:MAG: LPS-assembly protein LptD, partial [Aquificae bacterium]|nr:LPS-assembly protein LptD [Aquificota bacterium]
EVVFRNFCASKCADFQAEVCAEKFVLKTDGSEGTAYSATVKVEKVPVLYSPYYAFLTERRTGFLFPSVGVDAYGDFVYRQPFFWAVSPHSDATFTLDYRSGGLYGLGVELRKFFAPDFYAETGNLYYYDDAYPGKWWEGRTYRRKNRFLLSGKGYRGKLRFGWEYPSDKDFFYDAFWEDRNLHYKSFAVSFVDYLREEGTVLTDVRATYFYNLLSTDRDDDLALLPDAFFYLKTVALGRGLYLDGFSELTNFYARDRSLLRWRLEPRMRYSRVLGTTPLTFELKPFYTYYSSTRYGNYHHSFGVLLSTNFLLYNFDLVRTANFGWNSFWETQYRFQPFKPKPTPAFDALDAVSRENSLLFRNLNRFLWRGKRVAELIVEQPYNFYGGYTFPTDGAYLNYKKLPLKLYYLLGGGSLPFSLNGKLYYDHNLGSVFYHSLTLRWEAVKTSSSGLTLRGGYFLSKDHRNEVQTEQYNFGLSGGWKRLVWTLEGYYDQKLRKTVDFGAKFGYRKECWEVSLDYRREFNRDGNRYEWQVFLTFSVFSRPLNLLLLGGQE